MFSPHWPADGVWLRPEDPCVGLPEFPVAAVEIVVSALGKTLVGSVSTLELIAPALAVVMVADDEVLRSAVRSGMREADVAALLTAVHSRLDGLISRSRQRFEIWTTEQLRRRVLLS
jgi:hypothetical protein